MSNFMIIIVTLVVSFLVSQVVTRVLLQKYVTAVLDQLHLLEKKLDEINKEDIHDLNLYKVNTYNQQVLEEKEHTKKNLDTNFNLI